jgi:outer membrane beta-barrel protein
MRPTQRKTLLIAALACMASTAVAEPKNKGGKGGAKPAAADDGGEIEMDADPAGAKPAGGAKPAAKPAKAGAATPAPATDGSEIDMGAEDNNKPSDLAADTAAMDAQDAATKATATVQKTPVSWSDILIVIRKPFLKTGRWEFQPMLGTTMNDNMVQHYGFGGMLNHYLTDVLAVGVEAQYYTHSFNAPFDLVARQARRLPSVNAYKWSAALDFHYVPVYGKFAILDKKLVTWEAYFTAGIGAGQSSVIPRDPKYAGFNNLLIEPNVGASMRFFLAKWLTITAGVRDYVFYDHFESIDRAMYATPDLAAQHATGALINNVMFQLSLSFWVPTTFEYTTFR